MVLSDHHPITLTMTFPEHIPHAKTWRLDASILTDKTRLVKIHTCLINYFRENNTPDTSQLTLWEAHICVIRGKLLALASTLKREKQTYIRAIFSKLKRLETTHKPTLVQQTHQELVETRILLQEELGPKLKHKYTLSQNLFYEFSNKNDHLLAQALRSKKAKAKATVHQLNWATYSPIIQI